MNKLSILHFPDPKLRTIAKEVCTFDKSIQELVKEMYAIMYEEKGVGLAATQVDRHIRVIVTDCGSLDQNDDEFIKNPIEFINPKIISKSKETNIQQEGCLSVPEIYADITRADKILIKAMDRYGKEFTMNCEGLLSVCIQHEIDHLDGKLFIDYLSAAKRNIIREKMKKYERNKLKESKKDEANT